MDMEETRDDAAGSAEQRPPNATWWPSDFMENFGAVTLESKEEILSTREANNYDDADRVSSQTASQILWRTGTLSEPIPNGFYSVIPDKRLKELFDDIPTLDELYALGVEGFRADTILVDTEKDKKLSMLKQLIVVLVKNLSTNPAAMIKKIAGLVSDFYKRPNLDLSPAKAALEEASHAFENRSVQMLGQIKHGSCRPRAILFKVLADTVGLESRLMMGLPNEGDTECVESYKHMSVIVVLNSTELLVDLMRFPGQLIPRSTKAIFMTHISAAGESDSAENDSCDSPLEPNSPLYGVSERVDTDSLSHSEPNIATTFWRRSRRKVIAEQRTASSSPEHPSFRARGRSMLSGDRKSLRDYADDIATSRSVGASTSETRRIRRRSISITPEIGDDIARAVRAMNETLKQNRLSREQGDDRSFSYSSKDRHTGPDHQKNVSDFEHHDGDEISGGRSSLYAHPREQMGSQKAISLPSSPHEFSSQTSEIGGSSGYQQSDEAVSTWNKVLELPLFQNKPLLPFQEWNIDYRELTVGTRVGIGFFGEVFRGIWNGTDVAIKVFLEQDLTAENMQDFCNEISILSRLRHPNVILFLGACTKPPHLSMVTEYMEMGSLYYLIHLSGQKKKLSWRRRLKMLRDICRGLMCIHRMKIVHRDLKSANCLVNKHWTVKICDFGLSRMMTDSPLSDSSAVPYGYETQYVISYSQTTEPDDPDIDFVEYDPTPFRGGYDPVLTYGKPLPPSDEICYPRSLHVSNGPPSDGFSYGSIPSPYGKDDSDPKNTVKPREETEPTYPSTGDNGHLLGEEIPPEKPSDSGQGDQDQRDSYGSEGCDPPWPGYDYGSGNGHDHKEVAHQLPYGYGLEAMDLCESLFGYWPCLSRKKKYYGYQEFGSSGEVGQDHQWKNSAADYLFGSPYGYNYGGHYHYQQSS